LFWPFSVPEWTFEIILHEIEDIPRILKSGFLSVSNSAAERDERNGYFWRQMKCWTTPKLIWNSKEIVGWQHEASFKLKSWTQSIYTVQEWRTNMQQDLF
jgi:hypothetical protein